MGKEDPVVEFSAKFSKIVSELRCMGETIKEKEVIHYFLQSSQFD